uniref:hypothetical protein n=1 Tax=Fluviicola sp. TaxID=1917219 RepID=UPI0031D03575
GALVYSPLAYGTGSVSPSVIAQGSVDFYGAAVKVSSENVLICGAGGRIQEQFGAMALINQNVFIPGIADIHFKDASSATLIAKNFVVRSTTNAGGSWNLVKPAGTTIPAATYSKAWTLAGGKSLLFGSGNTLLYNANTDLTVTAFTASDVKALAAGTNDQNIFFVDGNLVRKVNLTSLIPSTVHTLSGSNPVNAMQVFANGDHILVGDGGLYKHYTASGTLLSYSTGLPSADFKALAFLDNLNGIIVGNGGVYYKSTNATISTSGYLESATWEVRNVASSDPMGVSGANIYALAVTSPTGVLIGGENPVSGSATTPYVRSIYDAGGRYSNRFWYDRLGRLVVSRNSRQELENKYSYMRYDALGRVYEAGEKTENPDTELQFAGIFGTAVSGYFSPSTIDDARLINWITSSGARKEMTYSYYDNVAINGIPGFTSDPLTQRLRVVHTTYEETYDGDDQTYDHATHYSYDIHGNVKTLVQDNQKMATDFASLTGERFKRLDYSYDLLSGNVHRMSVQAGKVDQWHHAYVYDADNRLRRVYTNTHEPLTPIGRLTQNKENELIANSDWQRDAQYYFYDHGPMARVEIGQNNLQGSDYVYNLLGWLKSVNGSDLKDNITDPGKDSDPTGVNALFAKDVYHFGLHYYEGDYTAISGEVPLAPVNIGSVAAGNSSNLYNSNIRYMETRITNPETREAMPMLNAYIYDQLNRLKESRSFETGYTSNEWNPDNYKNEYFNAFTYDAMGNILTQQRHKRNGNQIEQLRYQYQRDDNDRLLRNRLYHVNDDISEGVDSTDIDDMGTFDYTPQGINLNNNYQYDGEGRLVKDRQEEIDSIIWTVKGKVKEIFRTPGSEKKSMSFDYNSNGQRIAKHVFNNQTLILEKSTYYVLDPQGTQLAVYEQIVEEGTSKYYLAERNIVGQQRLGTLSDTIDLGQNSPNPSYGFLGNRMYELGNHLGNVLTVISDIVYPISSNNTTIDMYFVGIEQVSDYSPFGVQLDGRTGEGGVSARRYRYGFQAQEKDDEIKGEGNSMNYEFRMHDTRLGRFFAVDPLTDKFPQWSPYQFSGNQVISTKELEGMEPEQSANEADENETQYAKANTATNGNRIFAWTVNVSSTGSKIWVQGAEYTGPSFSEAALITEHVYSIDKPGVGPGADDEAGGSGEWRIVNEYIDIRSGYKAALYKRTIDNVNFYVFATAGTDDVFDGIADLKNGLGMLDEQMKYSLRDARHVSEYVAGLKYGNYLTFVGHSLGGGLAAANARATGHSAKTFNAMGLNKVWREILPKLPETEKIDAYVIYGEILDNLQRTVGMKSEGDIHYFISPVKVMSKQQYVNQSDSPSRRAFLLWNYAHYVLGESGKKHMMSNFLKLLK